MRERRQQAQPIHSEAGSQHGQSGTTVLLPWKLGHRRWDSPAHMGRWQHTLLTGESCPLWPLTRHLGEVRLLKVDSLYKPVRGWKPTELCYTKDLRIFMSSSGKIFYTNILVKYFIWPQSILLLFFHIFTPFLVGKNMQNSSLHNTAKHCLRAVLLRLFCLMFLVERIWSYCISPALKIKHFFSLQKHFQKSLLKTGRSPKA